MAQLSGEDFAGAVETRGRVPAFGVAVIVCPISDADLPGRGSATDPNSERPCAID